MLDLDVLRLLHNLIHRLRLVVRDFIPRLDLHLVIIPTLDRCSSRSSDLLLLSAFNLPDVSLDPARDLFLALAGEQSLLERFSAGSICLLT